MNCEEKNNATKGIKAVLARRCLLMATLYSPSFLVTITFPISYGQTFHSFWYSTYLNVQFSYLSISVLLVTFFFSSFPSFFLSSKPNLFSPVSFIPVLESLLSSLPFPLFSWDCGGMNECNLCSHSLLGFIVKEISLLCASFKSDQEYFSESFMSSSLPA